MPQAPFARPNLRHRALVADVAEFSAAEIIAKREPAQSRATRPPQQDQNSPSSRTDGGSHPIAQTHAPSRAEPATHPHRHPAMHDQKEHKAMTIARSAGPLLYRAIPAASLSRFIVAAAMIAVGLSFVTLTARVRGSGTSIHEPHGTPPSDGIAPTEISRVHAAVGAVSPPAFHPRYRLGY